MNNARWISCTGHEYPPLNTTLINVSQII
jgi:hypothetical protein